VFRLVEVTDNRGNTTLRCDTENPTKVRAAFIPQRGSKAEVPGQQLINIYRMLVDADTPDVDVWNEVEWNGKRWDVAAPPQYHHGTRRNRHISVDIRERP
jgi:hypothetical protein